MFNQMRAPFSGQVRGQFRNALKAAYFEMVEARLDRMTAGFPS
jgi:hypothetical protein